MSSIAYHRQTTPGALHIVPKPQETQINLVVAESLSYALRLLISFDEEEDIEANDLNALHESSVEIRRILDEADAKLEEKARILVDFHQGEANALKSRFFPNSGENPAIDSQNINPETGK